LDVRIADLGLSCTLKSLEHPLYEVCGTASYIDPEVLRGGIYSIKSDIFSVGSIMYNMATGCYLFKGKDIKKQLELNKKCDISEHLKVLSKLKHSQ
jgi:serine/threonine protein kinase